ncbi:MAG: ABC transporter ATP-binding protein, partial [Desulfobacterales bacterium]
FPNGFETIVGEKGVVLSGGQKQRIALARSLLKDTPILIMDDPISQVDLKTGAAIIKTIRSMTEEKTIIIVSHRLSAIRFADHIITLDGGRIVESGTHTELMEHGQYYAKTFHLQEIEEEFNAS